VAGNPRRNALFGVVSETPVCGDWMVVCAVRYEPVSTCFSLLTGKITGYFAISTLLEAISERKTPVPQPLLSKFPTKINRETIFGNREIFYRNREICNAKSRRPFLTHLSL
jgi:hypothetical protein